MEMLMEVLTPLATATFESADLILINKADMGSPEQVEHATQTALGINPRARVHVVSVKNELPQPLWEELDKWIG